MLWQVPQYDSKSGKPAFPTPLLFRASPVIPSAAMNPCSAALTIITSGILQPLPGFRTTGIASGLDHQGDINLVGE